MKTSNEESKHSIVIDMLFTIIYCPFYIAGWLAWYGGKLTMIIGAFVLLRWDIAILKLKRFFASPEL